MSNTKLKTADEINKRRMEIGAELAKGRFMPVPNARQLEQEDAALKAEYVEALDRESQAARDEAEIKARVEKARQEKQDAEREQRIKKAIAESVR